jgi:hypothetical protein
MRVLLVVLLSLHGLIHLLGFAHAWKLAAVPGLSGPTLPSSWDRVVGAAWLGACGLLIAAALMVIVRRESWWVLAAGGVVLSQALVFLAWHDAKAGSIVNLVLAVPIVLGAAEARFHARTREAVEAMLAQVPASRSVVAPAELERLPAPVRRWLETSGVVGAPRVSSVRLHQRGLLRTGMDKPWMDAIAEQHFAVSPPGFVWAVDVTMMRVLPVLGRDSYSDGRGRMLITIGGLVPIVDGQGSKIDEGTLLRYLGELIWFPSAALEPYIAWEPAGERAARATMTHGGIHASATFSFDERGRMVRMVADRFMGEAAEAKRLPWSCTVRAWGERGGVVIPTEGSVAWTLPEGDFEYYRWEITDVSYARLPRAWPRHANEGIGASRATSGHRR